MRLAYGYDYQGVYPTALLQKIEVEETRRLSLHLTDRNTTHNKHISASEINDFLKIEARKLNLFCPLSNKPPSLSTSRRRSALRGNSSFLSKGYQLNHFWVHSGYTGATNEKRHLPPKL